MTNLPTSLSLNAPVGGPNPSAAADINLASATEVQVNSDRMMASTEQLLLDLLNPELRGDALDGLLVLFKSKRALSKDLAPMLWNSFGTIAVLLQEIVTVYPLLSPPTLSQAASTRVCHVLVLLQYAASHPETRTSFLNSQILFYVYPFLNTTRQTKPFENLRLAGLGVFGALVNGNDTEVISFLLSTEIIPQCLRIMEMESELSKIMATHIVLKVLKNDFGLQYMCAAAERFFALGSVLRTMVASLTGHASLNEHNSRRLLRYIIYCYLRLSENSRAYGALKNCLPDIFRDAAFSRMLYEDQNTWLLLNQLIQNVQRTN